MASYNPSVRLESLGQDQNTLLVRLIQGYRGVSTRSAGGITTTRATAEYLQRQRLVRYADEANTTYANYAVRTVGFAATLTMTDVSQQIIASTSGAVNQYFKMFADAMKYKAGRRESLAEAHRIVAQDAKEAVLLKYSGIGFKSNKLGPYRPESRYPGMLRKALEKDDFIIASSSGILFGNTALLDSVAPHWRRMNYGAGARGFETFSNSRIPLKIKGKNVGNLSIDTKPSPSFVMPAGVFFNTSGKPVSYSPGRRGQDRFYLAGQLKAINTEAYGKLKNVVGAPKMSKGIRGYNFLEPGIRVIATRLPLLYQETLIKWIAEASDEVNPRGPLVRAGYQFI